jgi:hypothetical protein
MGDTMNTEKDYYIVRVVSEEDSDRGPFVIVGCHFFDGNVADVYGETEEDALAVAKMIVDALNGPEVDQDGR